MRSALALAAAAALGLLPVPARACSLCGCGDPLLTSIDPAALSGKLRLQLDTEYVGMTAGTEGVPGSTDHLTQWSLRLEAAYRPFDSLSFTAIVPFVTKQMRTVGGGMDVTTSDLSGLGDVELAGRWAFWRSVSLGAGRVHELALTLGTSLPTGRIDATSPDGSLVDPHGQIGTGAWGPYAGLNYRFEQGPWTVFAAFSARLRTEASYPDSSKYQFGNALLWSLHGQYFPVRRVAVDLGIDGRYATADRATDPAGVVDPAVPNTGGTVLAIAPGVYFQASGPVWLFARGQIPFVKALFGEQDVLPTFTAGVQLLVL